MGVNESEIEGATVVPIQGVEVKDAGEFAAYWNSLTPENREAFVGALRDASDGWLKCFQEDHERELEQIRRLHEVATERTVQLAAVIERAREHLGGSFIASDGYRSYATADSAAIRDLFDAADTGAALREVRAKAWDEGYVGGRDDEADAARGLPGDPGYGERHYNPYRQEGGNRG